jgi:hypothetical protein
MVSQNTELRRVLLHKQKEAAVEGEMHNESDNL